MTGHAGAGPPGHDLVCAAVSTMVQNLIASDQALTENNIKADLCEGHAKITFGELTDAEQLLVDSFFIGICGIATAYPDNVKII